MRSLTQLGGKKAPSEKLLGQKNLRLSPTEYSGMEIRFAAFDQAATEDLGSARGW